MNKRILRKFIYYMVGTVFLSFGIALSVFSNLGAGAFDALNYNLSHLLNITMGQAMYISVVMVYIVIMFLKPKKVYFIGLLLTTLVGIAIDAWFYVIPDIEYNLSMRILFFAGGLTFLPLGVAFIIKSKMPLSPMDNLLIILVDKTKRSVPIIKTMIETSFAVVALIYGISASIGVGNLSFGTIVITLTIGPGIGFFMRLVKDLDKSEIEKKQV